MPVSTSAQKDKKLAIETLTQKIKEGIKFWNTFLTLIVV